MGKLTRDFISDEKREYKIKFGHLLASSLSGFICGALVATVIWMIAFRYLVQTM
jgi:hypothetical protein